jgi:hypothetical protein
MRHRRVVIGKAGRMWIMAIGTGGRIRAADWATDMAALELMTKLMGDAASPS